MRKEEQKEREKERETDRFRIEIELDLAQSIKRRRQIEWMGKEEKGAKTREKEWDGGARSGEEKTSQIKEAVTVNS